MNKMIAALDGLKYVQGTTEYGIQLSRLNKAHLVGVFLDDIMYTSYKVYDLIRENSKLDPIKKKYDDKDRKTRMVSTAKFEKACQEAGAEYSVHHDRNVAIQELLHESVYADLIIINSRETMSHYSEPLPSNFLRDLLSGVQCPVLVTPRIFRPVENILFLYDGAASSMHAMKMFTYSLPELCNLPVEIFCVKEPGMSKHVPDNRLIKEFAKRHFKSVRFTVASGPAEAKIVQYLKKKEETTMVVLGAYRRTAVSRWFKPSMADRLMQDLHLPVFIAHNK